MKNIYGGRKIQFEFKQYFGFFFFYIGRSLCLLSALFLKFPKFSNIKLIAGAPSRSTRQQPHLSWMNVSIEFKFIMKPKHHLDKVNRLVKYDSRDLETRGVNFERKTFKESDKQRNIRQGVSHVFLEILKFSFENIFILGACRHYSDE